MPNRKDRRKERALKPKIKKPVPVSLVRECLPITPEQFFLATKLGDAAATGKMPRQSFASKFDEAMASGELDPKEKYLILGDRPINHAAMAMLDAFPTEAGKDDRFRQSLLWRTIFVAGDVYRDTRATSYIKKVGGNEYIGSPLVEAICTVPVKSGEETPLDAIFARAEELAKGWDSEADIDPSQ